MVRMVKPGSLTGFTLQLQARSKSRRSVQFWVIDFKLLKGNHLRVGDGNVPVTAAACPSAAPCAILVVDFGTPFPILPCVQESLLVHFEANPEFLRRAIQLATQNAQSGRGGPFGAVIVKDGRIVGEGVNTVTVGCDPTAHGEVNAIRAAARALGSFSLAGCQLYTSCEPCPMCLAASYWARVDAIFYGASAADAARAGFDDAVFYGELAKPAAERSTPSEQLLAAEAWQSFAAWLENIHKTEY